MDVFPLPDLPTELARLVRQVPLGHVTTCGGLAAALGHPVAARWVAQWSLDHKHNSRCICHRIIRATGELGGYVAGDIVAKARRLTAEGIEIGPAGVDLERFRFEEFTGPRPLVELLTLQEKLAAQIVLRAPRQMPKLVGGVDVAYPKPDEALGAYALIDVATGELVWSLTVRQKIAFPYITSFLTFRELPVHLEVLKQVRAAGKLGDVLMVDGTGILHPRRAGIASHFGVLADWPTIGITKKLLCGEVDFDTLWPGESRPVLIDDEPHGVALRPTGRSHRPIFISPGHRTSIGYAEQVVRDTLFGRRLPAAIYWADRLSKGRE